MRRLLIAAMVIAVTGCSPVSTDVDTTGRRPVRVVQAVAPQVTLTAVQPATLPVRVGVPTRILIPALGVDAPVSPVGVTGQDLAIPAAIETVGWYQVTSRPGSAGTALLVGHRDGATGRPGALYDLTRLPVGAKIAVTSWTGGRVFRVTSSAPYVKDGLPPRLLTTTGRARIAVVTCDGWQEGQGYLDNRVVVADFVGRTR